VGDKEHVVDEQRHPEGDPGHAEGAVWRVNGAHGPTALAGADANRGSETTVVAYGARSAERPWSSAGAALEPSAEPLALLTNHAGQAGDGPDSAREPRHRRPQQAPVSPADIRFGPPREYSQVSRQQPRSRAPEDPEAAPDYRQGQEYGSGPPPSPYVPAPGPDDDTPAGGVPTVEPPLWREAARYSAPPRYEPSAYPQYPQPTSPAPAEPTTTRMPVPADPPTTRVPMPPAEPPTTRMPMPPPDPPTTRMPMPPPEPPTTRMAVPPRPPDPQRSAQAGLPQRVPAEPDVPVSRDTGANARPEQPGSRDRWTAPELAWIADQLRRDDVPRERPPETFDVDAVVAAVGEVAGVKSATVRTNPTGVHTLRLDLADDADPGEVSRTVARLLLERMGLSAAGEHVPQARAPQEAMPPPVAEPDTSDVADLDETPPLALVAPPPVADQRLPDQLVANRYVTDPFAADQAEARAEETLAEPLADPYLDGLPLAPEEEPDEQPEPVSRPLPTNLSAPRVVINQVLVSTLGLEATVEVRLSAGDREATGVASGPAVDSYLVRLAAVAAAKAIDELLRAVVEPGGPSRCFVEHTGVVSFGNTDVAVAVVLLVCGGWVEQLTGSALVDGDPRQAVVRATLGAVNRRLEALLD
jgi:hypothetical protein